MNVNYNGKFRYNAGEFCANFDFMCTSNFQDKRFILHQ